MGGFFSSLLIPARHNAVTFDELWKQVFGGSQSISGRSVNTKNALEVSAVLACVRVIAEGVAQVPLKVYREKEGGGREPFKKHPLYKVLHRKPNSWQTSFEFFETLIFHVALAGNFFAFKNIVRGKIWELIPFEPGQVTVTRDNVGRLWYKVRAENGEEQEFPQNLIWHVRGPSWNSWMGLEIVRYAREAIGLAMATEETHARWHSNAAQASGLYSIEGTLDEKQHGNLKRWIQEHISGPRRFSPLILDRGAKFTPTDMKGVDAEHLNTRRYQVEEICRDFRVLPIMVGHSDKTQTFASAEQMFLAHVVHTLMPWYERLEESIDVNLLTDEDLNDGVYAKFTPNALMRGTAKDRAEFYYRQWQMGAMNPNEIRDKEEMNPYADGDRFYVPVNMMAVDDPLDPNANPTVEGEDNV